jgi:hypothetical protein
LNSADTMSESPMYNIFRHAFLVLGNAHEDETVGDFDGAPIEEFGDTIVLDLFDLNINDIETEAALVMNVWQVIVHELFEVQAECSAKNQDNGIAALDRAAALWIGEGQEEGSNELGHLLYNLAENAGERFDQDDGEAEVNTKVVDILVTIQAELLAGKCDSTAGYIAMRGNVKKLIGLMTIPLIQNLIHHTMNVSNEGGSNFVELYALGTIPRVAACDPAAYDDELHLDVLRELTVSLQSQSIQAIQKAYSCLGITCADVGSYMGGTLPQCDEESSTVVVAGYSTDRGGARQKSYLDRDILEIDIFLKFEAYEAALDWYTHGWNSEYTLGQLAKNEIIPATTGSLYSVFREYYQEDTFAHDSITNIMELVPPYNSASPNQVRFLVTGILKYVVMFYSSATALQFSVQECEDSNTVSSLEFWDAGAMFYVGSMEGEQPNGNEFGGEFLYTAAKELCDEFSTCIDADDGDDVGTAEANEIVMDGLIDAVASLTSKECDVAKDILELDILPAMAIPLLQGAIKYASYNVGLLSGTADSSLAIGYTFARGILPLVDQAVPASAQTIQTQMQFQLSTKPVSGGFLAVADALRDALPLMITDCDDIGDFEDEPGFDICVGTPSTPVDPSVTPAPAQSPVPAPVPAPVTQPTVPDTPAGLAWGRYTFSDANVAEGDGSFAQDVRDMFEAADVSSAKLIYESGENAVTNGLSGNFGTISLSSLSTDSVTYMVEDPMFNIFKYALYDDVDLSDVSGEDFLYADDVVIEALSNGQDNKLAAEGTVIMNVWMVIAHRLYSAVRACKKQENPEMLIDSAVALWIGKEQGEGKFDNGWMLYSVGQSAMQFYGFEEKEAPVNTELMNLFNEAQSIASNCESNADAYVDLRVKVSDLVRTLTKPLVLSLFFHMVKNSKNMVELYAVAVIPQVAACNSDASDGLVAALYSGYNHQTSLTDDVMDNFATFLRCQGITCQDMSHGPNVDSGLKKLVKQLCTRLDYYLDASDNLPMAGYTPLTDVTAYSRLDLDVLEIDIFTRTKAYKAATDVYQLGHNAFSPDDPTNLMTLQSLAKSSERDSVLQFQLFSEYYGSSDYADDIIMDALEQSGDYLSATRGQLSEVVFRCLQSMVTYMASISKMQSAVQKCNDKKTDAAQLDWDAAAALYIGSVEGLLAGRQSDAGSLIYSLANDVCEDFESCEASGEAQVNEKVIFQFAGGRDSIKDSQCDHVERTMTWEILPRMAIPLVQGVLAYAMDIEDESTRDSDSIAAAHILAKAVIPLVKKVNATSAATLAQSFAVFATMATGQPVDSSLEAFSYSLRGMGIDCEDVGTSVDYPDYSFCKGDDVVDGGSGGNGGNIAPLPDKETNLGDGLYVTSTYVQDRANMALDVKDMEDALNEGNIELAKLLYSGGENSEIYDEDGKFVSLRSLKGFSTEETLEMLDEPLFNIYMYALQDGDRTFMSKDIRLYANTLVEDAFQTTSTGSKTLPAEAAVALNVWMHIAHLLYKALKNCKNKEIRDEDGVHSMDVAVAYWIGDGQIAGNGDRGHLMYALSERMGELFNMDTGGQSRTNTNILKLFNQAKHEISLPSACSESPASYIRLSRIANRIMSLMAIPLIQGLIHNLRSNDKDRVKLYAHAVIPLVAGCSPSAFSFLKDKLINLNYNVIEVEELVQDVRRIYPCLGLQCADIGVHDSEMTDQATSCEDVEVLHPLAGYKPASDVREVSKMKILC